MNISNPLVLILFVLSMWEIILGITLVRNLALRTSKYINTLNDDEETIKDAVTLDFKRTIIIFSIGALGPLAMLITFMLYCYLI